MRSIRMFLLVVLAVSLLVPAAFAEHFIANCPLSFVGSRSATSSFSKSPHATFRSGSMIYSLRGQTLTTLDTTDLGDISVAREDDVTSMANRETSGGVAFSNGFLFVSGEAGLEIFDLRSTRGGAGGTAPILVSRTPGLHYRRLAVNGNILAGLYPATDLPCAATTGAATCRNSIDIFSISNLTSPFFVSSIVSSGFYIAFNDIAFVNGFLYATGFGGTFAFDLSNPSSPGRYLANGTIGTFLATNGSTVLAIGQDKLVGVYTVTTLGGRPVINNFAALTIPSIYDRSNDILFGTDAYIDDNRLITLVNERDPLTQHPARTIAFDVFDFSVPRLEGSDDRIYENVSYVTPDEIKYNPLAVGPNVYVVGEMSGTQTYGACDQIAGKIEFDNGDALPCSNAEIHGYVTGKQKITSIELYLDSAFLGFGTLTLPRIDVSSPTPVVGWRVPVSLNDTSAGVHTLRAVATDALGNRRQFNSTNILFHGPGANCSSRRRGGRQ